MVRVAERNLTGRQPVQDPDAHLHPLLPNVQELPPDCPSFPSKTARICIHQCVRTGGGDGRVPFYFGFGGRVVLGEDAVLGARFPFGIGKTLDNTPVEFFLEIVPILDLAPDTEFDLNGAVGVRYYLGR